MTYKLKVAGLERELPLCKISDDLYIAAFIMFGDVEMTVTCEMCIRDRYYPLDTNVFDWRTP